MHCRTWISVLLLVLADWVMSAQLLAQGNAPSAPLVTLQGKLLDPPERIINALRLSGAPGSQLNKIDEERILRYLDSLDYRVAIIKNTYPLVLQIQPYQVIRKIYIKGNWPLFEEEILRLLRFRPGQRMLEGQALEQAIARQEERLKLFLSQEGYFAGSLNLTFEPTNIDHQVDLHVRINKGHNYKVGEVITKFQLTPGQESALTAEQISRAFQQKIWFYQRPFNTERFRHDVDSLIRRYHQLGYPGIRVKEQFELLPGRKPSEAVRITLRISQRKKISLDYLGNNHLGDDELSNALTIYNEGTYDDYEFFRSVRDIHRLYQSEGYLQARVRFERDVSEFEDKVHITVDEGPRFRVREVRFSGNAQIKTSELENVVRTRPFPWLGHIGLGEGGYITDTQLKQDVERLVSFYKEKGFPETKVQGELVPQKELLGLSGALAGVAINTTKGDGDLYVHFTIDEGRRIIVDKVYLDVEGELPGSFALNREGLLKQMALRPGQPFTEKDLALDRKRLARIFGENGYPYATVSALEEYNLDETRVDVQFNVQPHKGAHYGPIFVRGNFKTRESIIRRDIGFKEGDVFDLRQIEKAERILRQREIFNVVRIQLLGIGENEQEEVLPVLITVEERYDDYGALEFAVGGSTDNHLFGAMGYTYSNLFGFGQSLGIRGEVGTEIQSGNITYRVPRIFGTGINFDAQGFVHNQETIRLGEIFTFGSTATLSKELLPHLTGLLRYEIRRVTTKEDVNQPAGVDEFAQEDVITQTAGIGPALNYDLRDDPLLPRRGIRLGTSLLCAGTYFGGHDDFLRLNVNGQGFIPLPKDITIAIFARYDQGFPLSGETMLPKIERFYAGGDTTIRGFERDMALVEKIAIPAMPFTNLTLYRLRPQGGNIRLLTNLEVQFPIWRESFILGMPIHGAVFIDNGAVTNSFDHFDIGQFRQGAGLALRLITPVGNSSLEYAFPLDPELGDQKSGRWHFNFGFMF